jgi:hypothetical protein
VSRPGIIIQHAFEHDTGSQRLRSDVVGFIGIVSKARWPSNASPGDFFEMTLAGWSELSTNPVRHYFDPVTLRAVEEFFRNGGRLCVLFGLCIESEADLMVDDPFSGVFFSLLDRLRGEEDLALIAMPVLAYLPVQFGARGEITVGAQPVYELLLAHCEEMNHRFLIMDVPRDLHDAQLVRWVQAFREKNRGIASFGAIYYPWLRNGDEEMPPSGAVAGVYARVDNAHGPVGVHWPPANEQILGVTHPSVPLRHDDAAKLTEVAINPILTQPTRGVVIWGARTLSKDRQWQFINTRRIVSYISEQLRRDSEWVVFENQRPELWAIVTRMARSRLDELWGAGLLGATGSGSGYMVQCDAETNPPELVDAGQINVRVMLQPISTTESIVIELRLGSS